MRQKVILIILALSLLAACTPISQPKMSAIIETGGRIEVYFCPHDNCSKQLTSLISSANESVYCAFYELELPEVINALKTRNAELVTDNDRNSSALMHNKFCVIGNKIIATGSFNPTEYGDRYNNNNLVIIYSEYLAQNYRDEFDELKSRQFGKGPEVKYPVIHLDGIKIQNYFCPEDSCADHITDELRNAKRSIYFMEFTFTHNDVANMLAIKLSQNITVKGVIEKSRQSAYSKYDFLEFQGAEMHYDKNPKSMHHKVFIIDNETVITGSFNPTASADTRNDENILIIHDKNIAEKYIKEFENLIR